MKLVLLAAIFIGTICFGSELEVATKIMDKISYALIKKDVVKVLAIGAEEKKIVDNSILMKSVKECQNADMVLSKKSVTCRDKVLFFTNYKTFKNNEQAIGAFFWQKGRPNIIFRKEVLGQFNIVLSEKFDKYIE